MKETNCRLPCDLGKVTNNLRCRPRCGVAASEALVGPVSASIRGYREACWHASAPKAFKMVEVDEIEQFCSLGRVRRFKKIASALVVISPVVKLLPWSRSPHRTGLTKVATNHRSVLMLLKSKSPRTLHCSQNERGKFHHTCTRQPQRYWSPGRHPLRCFQIRPILEPNAPRGVKTAHIGT